MMIQTIKNQHFNITIASFITVMLAVWGISSKVSDIQSKIDRVNTGYSHVGQMMTDLGSRIEAISEDNNRQDLVIVEIKTKLINIETILLEIKQKM